MSVEGPYQSCAIRSLLRFIVPLAISLAAISFFSIPLVAQGEEILSHEEGSPPSPQITGWSDINFSDTDEPDRTSGFSQGQIVLHMSSSLTQTTSVFSELSFSSKTTGTAVGVERLIIRFDQGDLLKLSFGRDHTPINWWNMSFHHGLWLQTSIDRPEMTKFGGTFIPVHFLGASLTGSVPAEGLNFSYTASVGNGRAQAISGAGDAGDANDNRAWLVNLFARPDRFFGLQIGTSFYQDKISLNDGRSFEEWIASAHFVWQKEDPEVIAEFANVNHRQAGGRSSDSQAYYIQVAYRLPWFDSLWKPYYRFERFDVPSDAVLFKQSDFNKETSIIGIRYDASYFAAFKGEYRQHHRQGMPDVNGYFGQVSFTF